MGSVRSRESAAFAELLYKQTKRPGHKIVTLCERRKNWRLDHEVNNRHSRYVW